MKIVSLLPSATEIAFALGLGDDVYGVTHECDHPSEAGEKPVVLRTTVPVAPGAPPGEVDRLVRQRVATGDSIYEIDAARVAEIGPDLILTQDLCRVCAIPTGQVEDALEKLGCSATVVSLDPRSLDGVLESILEVGTATGRSDRAREVVSGLLARVDAVRVVTAALPRPRTLALEWADPPFAGGHWVPEMVEAAGGENLLSRPGEPSREVGWEEVQAAHPDVVVHMPCGYHLEATEQEARALPPVGGAAVYAVDASSYFSRPGPRLVDGIEILAWVLHPDTFPEPLAGRVARLS